LLRGKGLGRKQEKKPLGLLFAKRGEPAIGHDGVKAD